MSTESEKKHDAALEGAKSLPEAVKMAAVEAVRSYYGTYTKKIKPIQEKLESVVKPATESLSKVLFGLAEKVQIEAGSSMERCRSLWASLTAYVEEDIKQQAEKDGHPTPGNMIAVVPAWASLKSTITQMFAQGLDIFEHRKVRDKDDIETEERVYQSIADIRAVTAKRGATLRAATTMAHGGAPSVGSMMKTTDKLKGALQSLSNHLAHLTPDNQDVAALLISEADVKIAELLQSQRDGEREAQRAIAAGVSGTPVVPQVAKGVAMRAGSR